MPYALCVRSSFAVLAVLICQLPPGPDPVPAPGPGVDPIVPFTGPPTPLTVTVAATPSTDLPIGHDVRLDASHPEVESPRYSWFSKSGKGKKCLEQVRLAVDGNWETTWGEECEGSVGKKVYRCHVEHESQEYQFGDGQVEVEFHKPNNARLKITKTEVHEKAHATTVEVTPQWKDQDIGACANVCVQEVWVLKVPQTSPLHRLDGFNLGLGRGQDRGWPEDPCAGNNDNHSDGVIPEGDTWHWEAPTLTDVYWIELAFLDPNNFADGQFLLKKTHRYIFSGPRLCKKSRWKHEEKFIFKLFVREVDGKKTLVWELDE